MIQSFTAVNWPGVLTAFVPYFLLGALWFTVLFKKQYLISLGKENAPRQKPAPVFVVGPAICCLVITLATALLAQALGISSYTSAIQLALVVGMGFLAANTVNIAINPNIPRPLLYGLISGAYHVVGIVIVCVILLAMK